MIVQKATSGKKERTKWKGVAMKYEARITKLEKENGALRTASIKLAANNDALRRKIFAIEYAGSLDKKEEM